jgi:molecular chaperone Hsp33
MNSTTTAIHASPNEVRRFILENQPVRGYWVDLDSAWQQLRAHQHYTPAVQNLLGEAVSASVLLAATLKFEGTLTLQLESKGDVRLLVAQCTNDFKVRAVARVSEEAEAAAEMGNAGSVDLGAPAVSDEEALSRRAASNGGESESGGGKGSAARSVGVAGGGTSAAGPAGSAAGSDASSSADVGNAANSTDTAGGASRAAGSAAQSGGEARASGVFDLGPRVEGADPFAILPRVADAFAASTFRQLVGENGRVIVTIEGSDKGMRYQGIVPLDGDSLADCLESYFASSEQLPTHVRLAANGERTVGLLLQKLPEPGGVDMEEGSPSALAWRDAERGIAAVRPADLVGTSLQSLLERRFGQRDVRVFKGAPIEFSCRCSQARVAGLLRSLGAEEVKDVLREQGAVEVTCEFCQRPYKFDAFAVEQLFAPGATPDVGQSVH